jgi:hypothetical protein
MKHCEMISGRKPFQGAGAGEQEDACRGEDAIQYGERRRGTQPTASGSAMACDC